MTDQKLKKCPCCPSGKGEAVEIAGMWIVRCNVCGITTQLRDTLEEAVADWNRRETVKTCPCCGWDLDTRRELPPYAKAIRLMNAFFETVKELDETQFMQIMNAFFTFTLRPIEDEGDENVTND